MNVEIKKEFFEDQDMLLNNLLSFFLSKEDMSNKKLQKLVYYTYALYYAEHGSEKHFHDIELSFEGWVHGPINYYLYQKLKSFSYKDISLKDLGLSEINIKEYFSKEELDFLEMVYNAFGSFTANQLEILTHMEDPWKKSRKGLMQLEEGSEPISTIDMEKFYLEKYGGDVFRLYLMFGCYNNG